MRVRVQLARERRAVCRPVLRHQPAGLKPNPTSITKRLWTHWPSPPLRGLLSATMLTFSPYNHFRNNRFRSFHTPVNTPPPGLLVQKLAAATRAKLAPGTHRHAQVPAAVHNNAVAIVVTIGDSAAISACA